MSKLKYEVNPLTGCWDWTGIIAHDGYGKVHVNRRTRMAHRFMWEVTHGVEVPRNLQIHHKCNNRRCVNPDHLEPVTAQVNSLLSSSPAAHNAKKEYCDNGHEFTEENTYKRARPGGGRACRTCQRDSMRTRRGKWKKEAAPVTLDKPSSCKRGHTPEPHDWYFQDNRWQCRECERAASARKRERNSAAPISKEKPSVCSVCSKDEFRWAPSNQKWLCVPCHKIYMKEYYAKRVERSLTKDNVVEGSTTLTVVDELSK